MPIEEASAKLRVGPPLDDEEDYQLSVWAGVVPLKLKAEAPVPDPRLSPGIQGARICDCLPRAALRRFRADIGPLLDFAQCLGHPAV